MCIKWTHVPQKALYLILVRKPSCPTSAIFSFLVSPVFLLVLPVFPDQRSSAVVRSADCCFRLLLLLPVASRCKQWEQAAQASHEEEEERDRRIISKGRGGERPSCDGGELPRPPCQTRDL